MTSFKLVMPPNTKEQGKYESLQAFRIGGLARTVDGVVPRHQLNGLRSMMVCSRSGPVEMMEMGTPTSSCNRSK